MNTPGPSRGLGLGRTWHRTSGQREPETRRASTRKRRGSRQGEQTKGTGRCTTLNTTTHKHASEDTHRHTHARNTAGLLHSRLLFKGAFGAFIRRDSYSAHIDVGCNRQNTGGDLQKAHRQQARHGTARRRTTRQLASSRAVGAEPKEIEGTTLKSRESVYYLHN